MSYELLTNQNNNMTQINTLFKIIGTDKKNFLNRFKLKKSKSIEFLELIDKNLLVILNNINKDNFQNQFEKSKKLFEYLFQFEQKISGKPINIKNGLIVKKNNIFKKYFNFFVNFSIEILKIIDSNTLSIEELNLLLSIQNELIELFIKYYEKENNKKNMEIMKNIKEYIETFVIISILLKEMNNSKNNSKIKELSNENKQILSDNIMNLALSIYEKTQKLPLLELNILKKTTEELKSLSKLYSNIFKKEFSQDRENSLVNKNKLNKIRNNYNILEKYYEYFLYELVQNKILSQKKLKK